MTLKREVRFEPGFDCARFECKHGSDRCAPGRGGFHGVHGLQMRWLVTGEKGVIQFLLMTDWLPEPDTWNSESRKRVADCFPMAADLGWHARYPQYEDQRAQLKCEFLDGAPCYYDGSGMNAREPMRVLVNEGGDALWAYLEAVYAATFDGAEWPEPKPYAHAPREVQS